MTEPAEKNAMPSPQLFFETINAYQRTAALKAALELEIFSAIGGGADTAPELAKRCGVSDRGVRILCDYLTVIGFLTKEGSRYALTPDSAAFLDRRSPHYMGGAVRFLGSAGLTDCFSDVAACVRKGGTVQSDSGSIAPENPIWVDFARSMEGTMMLPAEVIAQVLNAEHAGACKVLDIAAGHGRFGITLAKHNPHAEVVAADWHNVLEVAKENARAAGVAERYRTLPGSAFDVEFDTGYNIVLITNFLHHFDVPTIEGFLRKVHASLAPGGRAVVLEFIPDENRVSPPVAAQFAMMMLCSTPLGDAYTFAEYQHMFKNAGFASLEMHPVPPTYFRLVIAQA